MATINEEAVAFFIRASVLTFGDFTLKSGKKSPYFFNTGSLCTGAQLAEMGRLYAAKFLETQEFASANVLFGSAYKGIPIAVSAAIAAASMGRGDVRAVSDRKEAKTHGDVSGFLGRIQSGDRAVIVDDVISTGGTKLEALEKLREIGCEPLGFIIAFDRQESSEQGGATAREKLEQESGLPVVALASATDIARIRPEFASILEGLLAGR